MIHTCKVVRIVTFQNVNKYMTKCACSILTMATESLKVLLKCIEENENYESQCSEIVTAIRDGKKQILWVIEGLEEVLISPDVTKRLKGTEILSTVLKSLPPEQLQEDEITNITIFMCAKLKDHHNLIPAILQSFHAIVKMTHLPEGCIRHIVDGLSVEVQNQLQLPPDRRIIYQILQTLLTSKLPELQRMGTVFVYAVIGLVDAECNAKNLTVVFSMLPRMLANFKLAHLAEDMFEALACYFPIDVPTEGPDVIPRQVLSESLEMCLISSSELAPFALPLLLEKLNSALTIAKKDSLSLLEHACLKGSWGASELQPHLRELALALHREACRSDEVAVRTNKAMSALVHALSASAISRDQATLLADFIQSVTDMCRHALLQAEMSGFTPASTLVSSMARGSQTAATLVCTQVVPDLVSQYLARVGSPEQQAKILAALADLQATHTSTSELETWACTALYFEAATPSQDPKLRVQAFSGFSVIARVLSPIERANVYRQLESALVTPEVGPSAINCFCTLARMYPEEVLKAELFEILFQQKGDLGIGALCAVGVSEPFLSRVTPRLLDLAVETDPERQLSGVKGLAKLAETDQAQAFLCSDCQGALLKLTGHWLTEEPITSQHSLQALSHTASLVSVLLRNLSIEHQQQILQACIPMFGLDTLETTDITKEAQIFTSPQKAEMVLSILGSLRREVTVPSLQTLLCVLLRSSVSAEHPHVRDCCSRLTASLLNKAQPGPEDSSLLDTVCDLLASSDRQAALTLLMRLARALLLRGYSGLGLWMDKIISLLADPELGAATAECFHLVVSEENKFLSTECHAVIRLLYRQRLAQFLPQLEASYHGAAVENNAGPLLAMADIVHNIPKEVLASHLPLVVPVLIRSLHWDTPALPAALNCLQPLLAETNQTLKSHLTDVTNPCLQLAATHKSMKVRIAALNCVYEVANYKQSDVIALRQDVLEGLQLTLDDPKRLVRRAAVRAMGRWQLLGAPGAS